MDVSDILFILTSLVPVLVRRDVTRKLLVVASRCVINILSLCLFSFHPASILQLIGRTRSFSSSELMGLVSTGITAASV